MPFLHATMNEARRERQRKKFEAKVQEQMRLQQTFRLKPLVIAVWSALRQMQQIDERSAK